MSLQFLSLQSICKLLKLNLSKKSYVKSRHRQLELLGLEERVVPAPITVLNTAASGAGSLDAAITLANTTPGNDDIVFNTGVTGTIALTAALPAIINATSVILDSNNNPIGTAGTVTITGPSASPLIINGSNGSLGGFRIFTIDTGGNLSISGVTVTGANTSSYGGASLTLVSSLLTIPLSLAIIQPAMAPVAVAVS